MKFSRDALNILKNFSTINTSILLQPGNFVMTKSVNGVAYAEATIPDDIAEELGIYDLPSFLSILTQIGDDSEVTADVSTGNIVISNKRAKVFIPLSNASTIVSPKKRLQMPVADIVFDLSADDLNDVLKVCRAVNADMIAVTTRDGRLVIDAHNSANGANSQTLYSLDIGEYEGTETFRFVLSLLNMKMLPGDYKVLISSRGAVKFEGAQATYVVVLETSSESSFS